MATKSVHIPRNIEIGSIVIHDIRYRKKRSLCLLHLYGVITQRSVTVVRGRPTDGNPSLSDLRWSNCWPAWCIRSSWNYQLVANLNKRKTKQKRQQL